MPFFKYFSLLPVISAAPDHISNAFKSQLFQNPVNPNAYDSAYSAASSSSGSSQNSEPIPYNPPSFNSWDNWDAENSQFSAWQPNQLASAGAPSSSGSSYADLYANANTGGDDTYASVFADANSGSSSDIDPSYARSFASANSAASAADPYDASAVLGYDPAALNWAGADSSFLNDLVQDSNQFSYSGGNSKADSSGYDWNSPQTAFGLDSSSFSQPRSSESNGFRSQLLPAYTSQTTQNTVDTLFRPRSANVQAPSATTYAPSLFGDELCLEPAARFDSSIADKLDHNAYYPGQPANWICEFCGNKLLMMVERICCGSVSRKRRETEELDFWFNETSHEKRARSSKLRAKLAIFDGPGHNTATTENNVQTFNHLHNAYHPDNLVQAKFISDCTEEKNSKQPVNRRRRAIEKLSRSKRSVTDSEWAASIRNGAKGRSLLAEKANELTCTKSLSSQFLKFENSKPDRTFYKHTYLQRECCGFTGGKSNNNPQTCSQAEIDDHYLNEECCGEGCRVEEIYESCGSWRWDLKDKYQNQFSGFRK